MDAIPVELRGYPHPELLAETDWLQHHLGDSGVRVIDTRSAQLFEAGHIPGAVSLAAFGGIPRAENGDMGDAEQFEHLAGAMGVGDDTTVVVYDAPAAAMGMLAWAFLQYGHANTRMLDGGFAKWTDEGRVTSQEPSTYPPAIFHAQPSGELYCSLESAKASLGQAHTIFWDTRTRAEYEGTAAPGGNLPPRPGHLPGAVHLEWIELLDPVTKTVKPASELRALFTSIGITPESEVDCY
jgi:thiosulfate/3-mercaptopyruvate sulfurtransferase